MHVVAVVTHHMSYRGDRQEAAGALLLTLVGLRLHPGVQPAKALWRFQEGFCTATAPAVGARVEGFQRGPSLNGFPEKYPSSFSKGHVSSFLDMSAKVISDNYGRLRQECVLIHSS